MRVDKETIHLLARCMYAAKLGRDGIEKKVPESKSLARHKGELFAAMIHKEPESSISIEAQNYRVRAQDRTIDRIGDAASVILSCMEHKAMDSPMGSRMLAGLEVPYKIRSYGSYDGGEDAIIHTSFEESMSRTWDDSESWRKRSHLARLMLDIACTSVVDEAAFHEAVKGLDNGVIVEENGVMGTPFTGLHLAVDSGPIFPPLVRKVWVKVSPLEIVKFVATVRKSIAQTFAFAKVERGHYNPAVANTIHPSREKCSGKEPCPYLQSCSYGRYLSEQELTFTYLDEML